MRDLPSRHEIYYRKFIRRRLNFRWTPQAQDPGQEPGRCAVMLVVSVLGN